MTTSIVIPVFNQEERIGRAVRSALANQQYADVEIIIVDDGSTDHTLQELYPFENSIKVLINNTNKGLPYSLNRGIKASTGKYIFRLDSDDWIHERTISTMALMLDMNNSLDAIASDYFIVDESQNILKHTSCMDDPIGCSIMFRRNHLIHIGLYDDTQLWHEDKELMHRFSKFYSIFHLPVPFYRYFKHNSNMTSSKPDVERYHEILKIKTKRDDI